MITKEAIEAARSAIRYLNGPDTPWSDDQVSAVITAAHSAMPAQGVHSVVAAFEKAYPELYYHIAKGKICAGEPLYGAIITTAGATDLGHGESNVSADDAFQIAMKNAALHVPPPSLAAENERLRAALERIADGGGWQKDTALDALEDRT